MSDERGGCFAPRPHSCWSKLDAASLFCIFPILWVAGFSYLLISRALSGFALHQDGSLVFEDVIPSFVFPVFSMCLFCFFVCSLFSLFSFVFSSLCSRQGSARLDFLRAVFCKPLLRSRRSTSLSSGPPALHCVIYGVSWHFSGLFLRWFGAQLYTSND